MMMRRVIISYKQQQAWLMRKGVCIVMKMHSEYLGGSRYLDGDSR